MFSDRVAARIEGGFVVFLIGMRVNKLHRPDKWMPVASAMGRMLPELEADPSLGLLGTRTRWAGRHIDLIQYWRSFEHLHAYARARDAAHLPAWRAYNRAVRDNDAVGVWHEHVPRAGGRVRGRLPRDAAVRAGRRCGRRRRDGRAVQRERSARSWGGSGAGLRPGASADCEWGTQAWGRTTGP